MHIRIPAASTLVLTLMLAACGGGTPEAKEPESGSAEAPAKEADEKPAADDAKDEAKKDDESGSKSTDAPKEEAPKAARSAKDIITKPDIAFMFSFTASEAYQEADKKCTEKAKDDPKKKAECISKASKQFDDDGVAFQEIEGKTYWLTIRRKGNGLQTLHKIEVDFDGDSDTKVTVKPKGRDTGSKPMGNVPKELVVEVPSESQLVLTDPKLGKMVYEAKLGLLGEQSKR